MGGRSMDLKMLTEINAVVGHEQEMRRICDAYITDFSQLEAL